MATTLEQTPIRPFESEKIAFPLLSFEQFDLPSSNQRILGPPHPEGTVTPLALRPSTPNDAALDLDTVIETVRYLQAQGDILTKKLAVHGTLLFRDEIIGIVVDRPLLAPNVAPANESPKEVLIYNHNESPQVPHAPEYVFFYGHKAPEKGGETPISSSLELFRRAQQEVPELVDELAKKGILSKVTYKTERQYAGGSTLRQAFGKAIEDGDDEAARRAKVEAQIARYARGPHTTWEWTSDGIVLTHRLPAVRTQPGTGLPTLFTGLAAYYKNTRASAAGAAASASASGRKNVTQQLYGDGTPIPEEYLAALARITDEIRVLHKWQRGDVLVYDNIVAQHGREPWQGEQSDRVVMASLFDGQVPGAYSSEDWAQVVQALDG
ncbi:Clavaminate synthase-like protein [Daldinia caldariorum]|uniref:Clavaminate synthase-like protein n=1 Tax=Daldinia caldariorum TaxID=326644 RepID=UPI002008B78F|nr:Clavaminate synthase-like protein [Daldinia caldariorum]KAI1472462.1 Clavaminate synthase-like protein [Daldinia caldariorum]